MYTIEYYKTKREKEEKYHKGINNINRITTRKYCHQNDIYNKCLDIKSITIDVDDIKRIVFDQELKNLYVLYTRIIQVISNDNSIGSITILNNNLSNLHYIYEILNCKWMINTNENIDEIKIEKIEKCLESLKNKYTKTTNQKKKMDIYYKIYLIEYYLETVKRKYDNTQKEKWKNIRLGKHLIKQYK